jgi:hypothetical protein
LSRVSPARAGRLADLAALEDDRVLGGMVDTAQRDGLWDVVLPVTNNMSHEGLTRFTSLAALHEPDVLRAMVHVAIVSHVEVLPLVAMLPPHARVIVWAEIVALGDVAPVEIVNLVVEQALDLDLDGVLEEFIGAILDGDLLATGLRIFARMDRALQERIAQLAALLPSGLRLRIAAHARHVGQVDALGPLAIVLATG